MHCLYKINNSFLLGYRVLCECELCNTGQMMGPSKWERHTGSRKKKWKESIKLKNSNNTLLSWVGALLHYTAAPLYFFKGFTFLSYTGAGWQLHFMLEHGASGLAYTESNSNLPSRQRERKLAAYLQCKLQISPLVAGNAV